MKVITTTTLVATGLAVVIATAPAFACETPVTKAKTNAHSDSKESNEHKDNKNAKGEHEDKNQSKCNPSDYRSANEKHRDDGVNCDKAADKGNQGKDTENASDKNKGHESEKKQDNQSQNNNKGKDGAKEDKNQSKCNPSDTRSANVKHHDDGETCQKEYKSNDTPANTAQPGKGDADNTPKASAANAADVAKAAPAANATGVEQLPATGISVMGILTTLLAGVATYVTILRRK